MAVDLALDQVTGDLIVTANNDVMLNAGAATIAQRIRNRLRIQQGTWELDPTGQIGSRLSDAMRLPMDQALSAVPLYVKEALQVMDDIHVVNVTSEVDSLHPSTINFVVIYTVIDEGDAEGEQQSLSSSISTAG